MLKIISIVEDLHLIQNNRYLNSPFTIRIIFRPRGNKLVKMMSSQNGPVSGEVVKVVHDDGHEQVEDEEGGHDKEGDKVGIGHDGSTTFWIASFITARITLDVIRLDAGHHDLLPHLSCCAPNGQKIKRLSWDSKCISK